MFHHHDQCAILSPFYTIRVAFTKGPQPLVGCYSIFKHHSAKSQPPHRPALHTCNKLSSSETTKNELDQIRTGPLYWITARKHFYFCVTPKAFMQSIHVSGSFSAYPQSLPSLVAYCYCSSYPPAYHWCYAIILKQTKSVGGWMHLMQSVLLILQPEVQTYASATAARRALICGLIKHFSPKNAP